MTDDDLAERLRAVERALTDGDAPVSDLSDAAAVHDRLDSLEAEVTELGERLDTLDATVQSLHGYVGDVEAVNERVQRRADAAREAVERLEEQQSRFTEPSHTTEPTAPQRDERAAEPDSENLPDGTRSVDAERGDDESLLERVRESL
ncbi:DUF7310 family coiled-coil domain-containing protein [Halobacterium hubeiense]|uniref:DUF7310 family coiled-coil domain-containing protein n=1 Tax=Halobacterium hubeiense TaxID=1407499 RepID=UPI003C75E0F3